VAWRRACVTRALAPFLISFRQANDRGLCAARESSLRGHVRKHPGWPPGLPKRAESRCFSHCSISRRLTSRNRCAWRLQSLTAYALAVFISPNAVEYSVPAILSSRGWPADLQAVAIGQGSVALLAAYGIKNTLAPLERFDSEALLELPALQRPCVAGKRVVIFRGNGGRELLADSLRERGAEVDYVSCYQRSAPDSAAVLEALWRSEQLDALTVSSSEGLRNLVDLLDAPARASLRTTPVFVPHPRIAELAQKLGLQRGDSDRTGRCWDHCCSERI
jgi:uroporphyrinogen-III synthase